MTDSAESPDARTRILRTTLELIGRDGLVGLTNRRVARAAQVSLGSLTYHFDSQQQLMEEALRLFLREEVERLSALTDQLAAATLTPEQGTQALQATLQTETERRVAKIELYLHAFREPGLRDAAMRCFAEYDRLATAALAALGIPDAEAVAPMMVAMIDGLQLRRLASGEQELEIAAPLQTILGSLQRDAG